MIFDFAGRILGVLRISNVAKHELIEAVGSTLDAVDSAVNSVNFTNSKDAAITR